MNKADRRIRQALNPEICKLAYALYDKDIVCGQACPLLDHDCPVIMAEDLHDEITRRWLELFEEVREK